MSTRLNDLRALRAQIDQEIRREEAAVARVAKVRMTLDALTSSAFNHRVFAACCDHFGVEVDDVIAGRRNSEHTDARHVFMWIMRHEAEMSYPQIGRELGMDHTTVMNGVRRVEQSSRLRTAAAGIHALLNEHAA